MPLHNAHFSSLRLSACVQEDLHTIKVYIPLLLNRHNFSWPNFWRPEKKYKRQVALSTTPAWFRGSAHRYNTKFYVLTIVSCCAHRPPGQRSHTGHRQSQRGCRRGGKTAAQTADRLRTSSGCQRVNVSDWSYVQSSVWLCMIKIEHKKSS